MQGMDFSFELPGISELPEKVRQPVREFAELLHQLGGEQVKAWTVFGALAAGSFDGTRHSVRSVLVLEQFDLEFLRRLAAQGQRLGRSHFAAPLIMTPKYITASCDTFPLALIEIQQCHVAVFGPDYFNDLTFEQQHVRLRCEHELKAVLIDLHQGLLATAGRDALLGALEVDIAENLVRTMRGMLWLKGQKKAQPAVSVIEELEQQIRRPLPGVRTALDPAAHHDWELFERLYHDVQALGNIVDGW